VRTGRGGYEDLLDKYPALREIDTRLRAEGVSDQEIAYAVVRHIQAHRPDELAEIRPDIS
jgi:hypothetical protein